MDSKFQYVWDHFRSVYQLPAEVQVNYGLAPQGRVFIQQYAGDFFNQQEPWPQTISWQEWSGHNIPFLFFNSDKQPLISYYYKQVYINYDIIAATFYFLSGWQEYYAPDRDQFNRFAYKSSIQYKLGIITLPVVNYYFDILKVAIEKAYQIELKPLFNPADTFTSFITHDVDNTEKAWKAEGKTALKSGRLDLLLNRLIRKMLGRDAWFNWPEVADEVQKYGATATFFFLCENKPYQGYNNADYNINQRKYRKALAILKNKNCEIALHGSFETAVSKVKYLEEKQRLGLSTKGNRFHYLSFNPNQTPVLLDKLEVGYDSTLGFAEHFGFRHSYCLPFRLYNFRENKPHSFLEIPLNLMDATLDHPNYLQLTSSEILPAITPMLAQIKKFGGCFTLLWHNENFTTLNKNTGLSTFQNIMQYLQAQNSNFATGKAIYRKMQHFL